MAHVRYTCFFANAAKCANDTTKLIVCSVFRRMQWEWLAGWLAGRLDFVLRFQSISFQINISKYMHLNVDYQRCRRKFSLATTIFNEIHCKCKPECVHSRIVVCFMMTTAFFPCRIYRLQQSSVLWHLPLRLHLILVRPMRSLRFMLVWNRTKTTWGKLDWSHSFIVFSVQYSTVQCLAGQFSKVP